MGFAGIVRLRVAVEIVDHAFTGLLVFLVEPSIRVVPGTGQ
jgi:hypothetical protein